jgi:hypothetical protein
MTIEQTENGIFIDTEPVAAPDGSEAGPGVHIYAYARFRSLEHVAFGLYRTTGGPEDEEIDSEGVGQYGMEPIATYWEFNDALKELEGDSHHAFEEEPFVEVDSEDSYNEACEALGYEDTYGSDGAWPSDYKEPGLYDFRDDPPSYVSSVEDYEVSEMKNAAERAFDFMFQSDEWEDAYRELAAGDD